ncbi:hypothetical protein, partial [Vibrio parahaemolyticus]|uniref:hypothetical protein n=1 Tax=Vibrio parahaemolyticus TaxID=670 RepID=UPI003892517F
EDIIEDDISRLSPLIYKHINMLGHYTFTLPEDLEKGELRSLNFNNSEKYRVDVIKINDLLSIT